MFGRGDLFGRFTKKSDVSERSGSSGEITKDSGLEAEPSVSSGESRRDAVQSDLATALQNVNITPGRGRALIVQSFNRPRNVHLSPSEGISVSSSNKAESSDEPEPKTCRDPEPEERKSVDLFNPPKTEGSKGTLVNLACNYIGIKSDPNKGVFVYEVRFSPPVDSMQLRMKYLNEHKQHFGGAKTFDGAILYLPILLENKLTTFVSKSEDNTVIEVRVLFKKQESLKNCIHLYNILFDRVMKTLNYVRFDRKQYDPTSPKVIPLAKLEVWPGYVTAVDEYDGGLMLCCDVSHRLLCQKTVLEMLVEIYQHNKLQYQDSARKTLIGSVIITRYNNRTYKIDEIAFDQNPLNTFDTRTGSASYIDYYKKNHNINIRDTKQPLLLSIKKTRGDKNNTLNEDIRFCLIPELCYLTGLRDEIRADKKLMREIATFTRVSPNQRMLALEKFYTNVSKCPEAREILKNWGLSLSQINNGLVGRRMDVEQIYFAKKQISAGPKSEFSKEAANNELLKIVNLNNWLLIHCERDVKAARSLIDNMERCCQAFGMRISKPRIVSLQQDRVEAFVNGLRRNIDKETQIVVCIAPNMRDDRYAAIKKVCCSELPIASQVINARTLFDESKNRSIVQKIVLQMNCKMGGSLWTVKIPFKTVMICGIDSYHDAGLKGNSVAAFVASLNSTYSQWYSKAIVQTKREEIVGGLTAAFGAALDAYVKCNGQMPESVIIYRDGVGDGQLNLCAQYEIPQFKAVCSDKVKITFVVVQKRINTRFFSGSGNNWENPSPGTVVDKSITRNGMYDFFLVSQMVRQGTVSPSHYVVLRDDSNYGPDIIQRLTYKLCFMYYNWPGTVRVPACCLYAHKMAFLVGSSIQRDTAECLSEKLFYL